MWRSTQKNVQSATFIPARLRHEWYVVLVV
jgi:hypothetical protein